MSRVHPPVLRGKTFNVGYYTQTFQPAFVIPVMVVVTIDLYLSIPPSPL